MIGNSIGSSNIYQKCVNSVVTITITDVGNSNATYVGSGFFCQINSPKFLPDSYGYIVTAAHVIIDPSNKLLSTIIWLHISYPSMISFKLDGINTVVMGVDKKADIALIRITSNIYKDLHLPVKDSRTAVLIGEYVSAIGCPNATDIQSCSRGVVRDNKYTVDGTQECVYTDVSIFGGNSGGPLITDSNHVIGIISWIVPNLENLSAAVSSYLFNPILKFFCDNYVDTTLQYPKGYLGIIYNIVTVIDAMKFGINIQGIRITNFDGTIPAQFNQFDIITEIDGIPIGIYNNQSPFFTEIHLRRPGTTINVKYLPYNAMTGRYNQVTSKNLTIQPINSIYDVFGIPVSQMPYTP